MSNALARPSATVGGAGCSSMKHDPQILKGHVTHVLLAVIGSKPSYGGEIKRRVEELSLGAIVLDESTLYLGLQRLERNKLVSTEWQEGRWKKRIKVYTLTARGKKELDRLQAQWNYFYRAFNLMIEE